MNGALVYHSPTDDEIPLHPIQAAGDEHKTDDTNMTNICCSKMCNRFTRDIIHMSACTLF